MEKLLMAYAVKRATADVFWFEKGNPLLTPDNLFNIFTLFVNDHYKVMLKEYKNKSLFK